MKLIQSLKIFTQRRDIVFNQQAQESLSNAKVLLGEIDEYISKANRYIGIIENKETTLNQLQGLRSEIEQYIKKLFTPQVDNGENLLLFNTPYVSLTKLKKDFHAGHEISQTKYRIAFEFTKDGRFRFTTCSNDINNINLSRLANEKFGPHNTYELWNGNIIRFDYSYYHLIHQFEGTLYKDKIVGKYLNLNESETFELIKNKN